MRYLNHTNDLTFRGNDPVIGYSARQTARGPEQALVDSFLATGLGILDCLFHAQDVAVFVEPRLDSGFPDIVLARFKPGLFSRWRTARSLLTGIDLKVLSFLQSVKGADSPQIHAQMHLSFSEIRHSVELLQDAGLISRDSNRRTWIPKALDETFGLDCLVAVEAKIRNAQEVLDQAALNCWFASESYALTPTMPTSAFSRDARRAGVGLVSANPRSGYRRVVAPRRMALPSSYVSWQFNEWVGRRLNKEGV